jgi:hypothetical protein
MNVRGRLDERTRNLWRGSSRELHGSRPRRGRTEQDSDKEKGLSLNHLRSEWKTSQVRLKEQ